MASYEFEANVDDIPVLDLSRCEEEKCLQTVREACQELGCFRIVNHAIAPDLLRNVDFACREVFKLPTETKRKNVSSSPLAGYLGGIAKIPFYESQGMILTGASDSETIRHFSRLMWPHGNQNFCQTMEEYTRKMVELLDKVQKVILASFGVSEYFATHFDHGKAIFRMNMYDVPSELLGESIGLSPHTDLNSLTILHEDECGGFQIWKKEGNWVDVKSIPDSFVAVTGDCFQAWSNGRIHGAKHRVMVKNQQSRLCLGFFNNFPDKMEINSPPEFIDDDHPQCYKTFTFGDFIKYWLGEGRMIEDRLHSFCSIND